MSDKPNPLDIQVGGNHYKVFAIQPVEFIEENGLGFLVGCIIKRVCRYDQPTGKGVEDLKKVAHEIDLFLYTRGAAVSVSSGLMPGAFSLAKFRRHLDYASILAVPLTEFIEQNKFGDTVRGSLVSLVVLGAIAERDGFAEDAVELFSAAWIAVIGLLRLHGVDLQSGEVTA